jgi:hypothetical protein
VAETFPDPSADPALAWTPADDELHPVRSDRLDWTETVWFSFALPERSVIGWLYCQIRPNNGTVAGGAFVYDPSGSAPWEIPYYAYTHYTPLPVPIALSSVTFASGVRVRCLEPGRRYAMGYQFRDQDAFVADLEFRGLTPPVPHLQGSPPFTGSSHYDQMGRVTGTVQLHGEPIAVDCISMRDRSWGRRPELLGRRSGDRVSYAYGASGDDEAFLVFAAPPPDDPYSDVESLTSGWLLRGGALRRLTAAERRVDRSATGAVRTLSLDGVDSDGRVLNATATAAATMFLPAGGLCINSALHWDIDGRPGFGEDQDVWSLARFGSRSL